MFLDSVVTFGLDESGLTGLRFEWTFDPMFSAMIIMDMDRNQDKAFNAAELEREESEAFSNIRNYGYFTYVTWRGKESRPAVVEQFQASIDGDRLVHRFFVPFRVELASGGRDSVSVAVYDETFCCDCRSSPEWPVRVREAGGVRATSRVVEDPGMEIRYSTTDGSVSTNLGTRDKATYTGLFHPKRIVVELPRG